ncbi:hypothetical protein B0H34DRAFT_387560 [Crassisporium funariophilum]|nr:hypothetical protein B0H34DRAFT_387560 [Crassisporium funariophilum]
MTDRWLWCSFVSCLRSSFCKIAFTSFCSRISGELIGMLLNRPHLMTGPFILHPFLRDMSSWPSFFFLKKSGWVVGEGRFYGWLRMDIHHPHSITTLTDEHPDDHFTNAVVEWTIPPASPAHDWTLYLASLFEGYEHLAQFLYI